jgi:hypothetical protein
MDEFTADPTATEKEAQRVLRKMQADKNVAAAKAAESKAGVEESRAKLREMGYLKGDSSLEAKYPGAKITKVPPNEAPAAPKKLENPREFIPKDVMPEYERKAEKFEKAKEKRGGGGGGGGGVMPIDKMLKMNKMNYKAGGKVSSASSRADGCAIRGKTRA